MELYMDEKWKLSKKGSRNSFSRRGAVGEGPEALLKRSASAVEPRAASSAHSFSNRCSRLVKEQRAKFYIMRRCVVMLICWRDYP